MDLLKEKDVEVVAPLSEEGDMEEAAKHIRRLQALRETGAINMATELRSGLVQVFGEEEGMDTYKWASEDNAEYYFSGRWVDVDVSRLQGGEEYDSF